MVADVQYSTSKKITLPDDPNALIKLSNSNEEFVVRPIFFSPTFSSLYGMF